MRFVDLFAGTGAFHYALRSLGHECVFASELNVELRDLYQRNFPETRNHVFGDIRECKHLIPPHDILCGGFPCQPFSKSGMQLGMKDPTRGTLFHEILEILRHHRPLYVILENVGNFERHDKGRTWSVVRTELEGLGYNVRGTEHISSGGHGLISPHHFGFPHHRERFFIVASLDPLLDDPYPRGNRNQVTDLGSIVLKSCDLSEEDKSETKLTQQQVTCINHWNNLLRDLPLEIELPSFPIWGDEIEAEYPFESYTPFWELTGHGPVLSSEYAELLLSQLPSYARTEQEAFPDWKKSFIRQNRAWFSAIDSYLSLEWREQLRAFPPSLRKLEWNCQGEERDLWKYVLQFRPSGLRVKRYTASPALVSMTTTQIPILGPEMRFIARKEGLLLQGLPECHLLPKSRERSFAALGNAVHVGVVSRIAERIVGEQPRLEEVQADPLAA